jgi:hypothetical protein
MSGIRVVHISGEICTDPSGHKKLMEFYKVVSEYNNEKISIDFYKLEWIDANLSALLQAMLYSLTRKNNLLFSTDFNFLLSKFDILFRNGFLEGEETSPIHSYAESAVPLASFLPTEKDKFIQYIKRDLLEHKGMPSIEPNLKSILIESFLEIFTNINIHADTKEPLFACGQYFPKKGILKFTFLDLGIGYLKNIETYTKGKIKTSKEAIKWAIVEGNSTKKDGTPGGLGLVDILNYCKKYNGTLQIITGDAYWGTDLGLLESRKVAYPFPGTTINLTFKCK